MRITSKGQVTIPGELREKFGLLPFSEVEFLGTKDGVVIRKAKSKKLRRGELLVNRIRGSATVRMSTDEILKLTRDR